MSVLPLNNPILLGSVSTTGLKEDAMLFVKEKSIYLSNLLSIITSNGFNFVVKLIFNKQYKLLKKSRIFTLTFNEKNPGEASEIINYGDETSVKLSSFKPIRPPYINVQKVSRDWNS